MTNIKRINAERRADVWPPARGHVHDPHPAEDPLAPARGIGLALLISIAFWALVICGPGIAEMIIRFLEAVL